MKKIILIVIILMIAAGGWYAYNEYNRTNVDLKNQKVDITIGAADLIKKFEDDSAMANKNYVDKVVVVNGTIKKIDGEENPVIIFLGNENEMSSVQCSMDSTYSDEYKNLRSGLTVTVKGMLNGAITDEMFGTDVKLNRCVIFKQ